MRPEVLVTSPYPEIAVMVERVAEKLGIPTYILEGALDEIMDEVQKVIREYDIKVIISRGATASILKRNFQNVSVITIDPSDFDIIKAFDEAKKTGKQKIAFLCSKYSNVHNRVFYLTKVMDLPVKILLYGDTYEFSASVEEAFKSGIEVIIGGGKRAQDLSRDRGIIFVPLVSSEETITDAFLRAKEIIEASKRELERAEWFRVVVEYSNDGIIAIDRLKQISLFNPAAKKILGIHDEQIIGRQANDILRFSPIYDLINGEEPIFGELKQNQTSSLVVNRVPVIIQGETKGTLLTIQSVSSVQRLEMNIRSKLHKSKFKAKYTLNDLVYKSQAMKRVIEIARKFAPTDSTILLQGESGTGKELLAQGIHLAHPERCLGPFVALNCAIITGTLLESELFGYEEGSFTGAKRGGKVGLFEIAHGGTIFLDEIGKMPIELQGSLLRVLQEREIRRIGGSEVIPVNVRVIAATNEDLGEMVKRGKFREDLFYRLKVLTISIPPLRERIEDIDVLAFYFLERFCQKYKKKVPLSRKNARLLKQYPWPGNVRQLENFIERYVLVYDEEEKQDLLIKKLLKEEFKEIDEESKERLLTLNMLEDMSLRDIQKEIVNKLLSSGSYSRSELAKKLGISRTTLWKMLGGSEGGR